jgi:hypothetical protein
MITPTNNIATLELTNAASAYFNAETTLYAKRLALGDMLTVGGFDITTDFAAATAKKADRADRFEAIKFLAQEGLPSPVRDALRNDDLAGKAKVDGDGVTRTKTEWSRQIPAKVRTLQSAYAIYLDGKSEADTDGKSDGKSEAKSDAKKGAKKGAKSNAPRELSTRIDAELSKLISAVRKDKDGEPTAKFDHDAMIKALTAAADLAK